jgi:hypothetical protein
MKKQDSNKLIEQLETEIAKLKSDRNIATQSFEDIIDLCFSGINESVEKEVVLRSIIKNSLITMDWINNETT